MLAGDSEVGKTSLLIRMCDNVFTASSVTTIGIDMKMRSVEVDGRKAMMQIWDTAGQESCDKALIVHAELQFYISDLEDRSEVL
ncbi:unnamed protein product [Trichobilharzia regenti]|nr:unnamed protein product [Trichobilharzia regenti]